MRNEQELEELKEHLQDYVERITTHSRDGEAGKYICPLCGSGKRHNGTGAFSIDSKNPTQWHCFSCGEGGDVFDLIGKYEGLKEYRDKLARARELYGTGSPEPAGQTRKKRERGNSDPGNVPADPGKDYTPYYEACARRLQETDYHRGRGISDETARRYGLGYDPAYNQKGIREALIIPVTKSRYIARKISGAESANKYDNSPGEKVPFNLQALKNAKSPVFIVEGALDALSIIEAGGEAIAIEGNSLRPLITKYLKDTPPAQPLIIALDNDPAGRAGTEQGEPLLKEAGIKYYIYDPCRGRKDANTLLQEDADELRRAVAEGMKLPEKEADAEKEAYLQTSSLNHLQAFINGIADSVNTEYTPTGFKGLDDILGGGLYEGLYFVGALPSLGKTTLVTQIADNIAQAGRDVLIFSLEMARSELMAKSISRLTLLDVLENKRPLAMAKTDRGITTGSRYKDYSAEEKAIIKNAIKKYSEYAGHVYIHEGVGDIGAEKIREAVKRHIVYTGRNPVVIVDYLQILAPYNDRASDKQNTDKAVLELKRISRDYKLPIIGVSSLNRENYNMKISMQAFKESGAIEYGCDVLIGLQLKGAGGRDFNVDDEMKKNPRQVEALILKNRHGSRGDTIQLSYYPLFNYFYETGNRAKNGGKAWS